MIDYIVALQTVATFFQGYSFGARRTLIFLISTLIMILGLPLTIIMAGTGNYVDNILGTELYYAIVATTYVLSWWLSGYLIGHSEKIKTDIRDLRAIDTRIRDIRS